VDPITQYRETTYYERDNNILSIFVFNKFFAKRFALDETKAITLDPGLYAIELTISKDPDAGTPGSYHQYTCQLNLYLDSNLKLRFPEGTFGDRDIASRVMQYEAKRPLFHYTKHYDASGIPSFKAPLLNELDEDYNLAIGAFYLRAAIDTTNATKEDSSRTLAYKRYRKEWMPGITYIELDLDPLGDAGASILGADGCQLLYPNPSGKTIWLDTQDATSSAQVIDILKEKRDRQLSVENAAEINSQKLANFYHFQLPVQITNAPEIIKVTNLNKHQFQTDFSYDLQRLKNEPIMGGAK